MKKCPLKLTIKCTRCRFSKEGLCDYPYTINISKTIDKYTKGAV